MGKQPFIAHPLQLAAPGCSAVEMVRKRMLFKRFRAIVLACLLILANTPAHAKTFIDQFGRHVQVPDRPQRIVAMAPSITEIIFALGLSERLVGATQFSDYPPIAETLPKVGSYVHLDVEKIVSLEQDLCIAVKDGNPISVVRKLESVGIPVYAVDPRNAVTKGIAQALITTASGLGIAILTVFPFNYFNARIERAARFIEKYATSLEIVYEKLANRNGWNQENGHES